MDQSFNMQFPFTKVDPQKRIVSGIATADNIDKGNDIVDYAASLKAFANWVGNIREMHAPKAVGHALSYSAVPVKGADGKTYRGIQVDAYISKGAEDTWQKVLDKTLSGFSIGGKIIDQQMEYHAETQSTVRRITNYVLGELSVVDNPANPAAQISVIKMADGILTYDLTVDDEMEKAADTYSPPDGVRAEARRALEWIANGEAGSGFTDVGRRRASQLANGNPVSLDTIKRMSSYLARHAVDKNGQGWSPGEPGYPSPGRVAWAAWGGDPAVTWTNKILKSLDKSEIDFDLNDFEKSEIVAIYFCDQCAIATMNNNICNSCSEEMDFIGEVEQFEAETISKMIETHKKGGIQVDNLQKNEKDDNIETMSEDSVTISAAAIELLTKMAGSMVPTLNIFPNASGEPVVEAEVESLTKSEENVDAESESTEEVEGGEEVNTEELLKSLTEVLDGKLNEFKEQITATVDEKIDAVVTKSADESDSEVEEIVKSDEVAEDEKDALIKSLTERITALEETGAMKKSLDDAEVVEGDEVITKNSTSLWNGFFVPMEVVNALGYES